MNKWHILVRVSVYKSVALLRRYLFDTVMRSIALYLLFMVIFFGGRSLAPTTFSNALEGIIVGFFVWTMAISAYTSASSDIIREAQWGTLEQLQMSPYGFGRILLVNNILNVLGSFGSGFVVLAMMLLTTGKGLSIPVVATSIIGLLTLGPAIGLGFVVGGFALLYKRVAGLTSLMQFGFITFIAIPLDAHPIIRFLPLTLGTSLLQTVIADGMTIVSIPPLNLVSLCIKSLVYVAVGYAVLQALQRRARRRGILGHY